MVASTPMRVPGKRRTESRLKKLRSRMPGRLTFSPRANLTVRGAPAMSISRAGRPYLSLIRAFCPPIEFALPCMVWMVVTPPVRAK